MKPTGDLGLGYSALLTIACVAASSSVVGPALAGAPRCDEKILLLTHQIVMERDETARGDLAEDLAQYLHDNPRCGTKPAIIAIARLLTDKSDGVRWGAAEALGDIGPNAKSTVSALERALKESDEKLSLSSDTMLPTRYSGQAIREALTKITGKKIPDYNDRRD